MAPSEEMPGQGPWRRLGREGSVDTLLKPNLQEVRRVICGLRLYDRGRSTFLAADTAETEGAELRGL